MTSNTTGRIRMFKSCFGFVGIGLPRIAWLVRWQGARTQSKLQAIYLDKFAACESVEHGQDLVKQVHPTDQGNACSCHHCTYRSAIFPTGILQNRDTMGVSQDLRDCSLGTWLPYGAHMHADKSMVELCMVVALGCSGILR